MPDKPDLSEPGDAPTPDPEEAAFFERLEGLFDRGFDRWLARADAETPEDDIPARPDPSRADAPTRTERDTPAQPAPARRTAPPPTGDDDGQTTEGPTPAERQRDELRRGPRAPRGYWTRAERLLYGRRREDDK